MQLSQKHWQGTKLECWLWWHRPALPLWNRAKERRSEGKGHEPGSCCWVKGWLVPGAGLLRPRSIPPVGVNAECLSTSPTLISFPVALWSPQLWSDEVEKVSTQLKWCSNLFGRAGGVQCGCCRFLPTRVHTGKSAPELPAPMLCCSVQFWQWPMRKLPPSQLAVLNVKDFPGKPGLLVIMSSWESPARVSQERSWCAVMVQLCSCGKGPACPHSARALCEAASSPLPACSGERAGALSRAQGDRRVSLWTTPADGRSSSVRRAGWEDWSLSWSSVWWAALSLLRGSMGPSPRSCLCFWVCNSSMKMDGLLVDWRPGWTLCGPPAWHGACGGTFPLPFTCQIPPVRR